MSYSGEICELFRSNDRVGVGPQASNPRLEFAKERDSIAVAAFFGV